MNTTTTTTFLTNPDQLSVQVVQMAQQSVRNQTVSSSITRVLSIWSRAAQQRQQRNNGDDFWQASEPDIIRLVGFALPAALVEAEERRVHLLQDSLPKKPSQPPSPGMQPAQERQQRQKQ